MSYQNVSESQIEGYNDCPIVDHHLLTSKRSVSGSSLASRRKRLVGHDLNSGSTSPNLGINRFDQRLVNASNNVISIPKVLTPDATPSPGPVRKMRISSIDQLNGVNNEVKNEVESQFSDESLSNEIDLLLNKKSSLPEREVSHYSTKISNNKESILKLSQSDKSLVYNSIITKDFNKITKGKLMTLILNNDGIGSWCLPLIKLLENVKNDESEI